MTLHKNIFVLDFVCDLLNFYIVSNLKWSPGTPVSIARPGYSAERELMFCLSFIVIFNDSCI